ncbi:MAG: family 20 glycosylhydrolase [Bacteroidales bacterium]|nr:family 20 glycosylhydrolase [Bacteroidales bacterium]
MRVKFLFIFCFLGLFASAQNTHILPTPQQVETHEGQFVWDESVVLTYDASDAEISQIVTMFKQDLEQISPNKTLFSRSVVRGRHFVEMVKTDHLGVSENEDQAYKMSISRNSIRMEATTNTGLFYATQSLKQLFRYSALNGNGDISLPCMDIIDWPNFKIRAWQDDISRGPIVKMEYLKRLIPQLAECKLNAFSLYTEHTFKTKCHPDIAPDGSFTAEEIKELEEFCRPYHIQIIGNQQCFGHFEEILCNPFYSHLADTKWNLNPANEETYKFLEDHLREVARAYKSPYFNINCDETESLGQGLAKAYVDSVGAPTAYYKHINRVNRMLRPYRKRVMMWGDIADSHPEILENLDKDIFLIAWSYVAKDDFNDFLKPYVNSGHKFFVAPGVSLSERVWPKHYEFKANIANLCRDGYKNGALGVINTCWDDFGESLINSALYGLTFGAEMSWNTIATNDRDFDTNFTTHFFGTSSSEIVKHLDEVSEWTKIDGIGKFSALTEPLVPFYPALVGDSVEAMNVKTVEALIALYKSLENDKKTVKSNADVIDNAIYAVLRMRWCAERNILRCMLYRIYNEPSYEIACKSRNAINNIIDALHDLKKEYVDVWNIESRPYWLDVNMKKYDDMARELQQLEYLPFIEPVTDAEGNVEIDIFTLLDYDLDDEIQIHYTLDGKEVTKSDPIYENPFVLERPCLVKAACFNALDEAINAERYFYYHKAMGKLKQLNSPAGNYRPEYSGGGDNALVDGTLGSDDYKDGHWQGFYGTDADLEIDLGKWTKVNALNIGFLVNAHDWILRPDEVEVYTSNDGKNYKRFKTFEIQTEVLQKDNFTFRERFETPNLATRYLRIVVKNPGLIPNGYPGSGYDSWIFMDEVMVE